MLYHKIKLDLQYVLWPLASVTSHFIYTVSAYYNESTWIDFYFFWQKQKVFIFFTDWAAQYIVKAVFSHDENGVIPVERQHSCCREKGLLAFTGLSKLNRRKPGKCQVFFNNIRSYVLFSSTLCFLRLPSSNVSASRVSSTAWSSPPSRVPPCLLSLPFCPHPPL